MKITFDQVRHAAEGRWVDLIFPSFGISVPPKKQHGPCPICGGKDRFRCDDKQGKGTWVCGKCEGQGACAAGDGFSLIERSRHLSYSDVLKEVAAVLGISSETKITDADRQAWKARAEQQARDAEREELKARETAAKRAERIWNAQSVDRDCPYIERKQVQAYGCKINGKGNLLVPLFDIHGKIWNIQEIHADGHKPFLPGGRVSGCFYLVGEIKQHDQIICIAEGYATAASIHAATGHSTVVAFNAGNIDKVGKELRTKYPYARLVYCADDDSHATPPDTGLKAANKAVAATGGIVILPKFSQVVTV